MMQRMLRSHVLLFCVLLASSLGGFAGLVATIDPVQFSTFRTDVHAQ